MSRSRRPASAGPAPRPTTARRRAKLAARGAPAPGRVWGRGVVEPGATPALAVVAPNARMPKTQVAKVAQMAHDGFARAIVPVHTPADGDTAFAIARGSLGRGADPLAGGSLAPAGTAEGSARRGPGGTRR